MFGGAAGGGAAGGGSGDAAGFAEGEVLPESHRLMSGAPERCTKPRLRRPPRFDTDEAGEEVAVMDAEWTCVTVDSSLDFELEVAAGSSASSSSSSSSFLLVHRGPQSRCEFRGSPGRYRLRARAVSHTYGTPLPGEWSMEAVVDAVDGESISRAVREQRAAAERVERAAEAKARLEALLSQWSYHVRHRTAGLGDGAAVPHVCAGPRVPGAVRHSLQAEPRRVRQWDQGELRPARRLR